MSEERNQTRQKQSSDLASWETQLQSRANELLAQRIAPFKAEIERLQTNISEISSRLAQQESGVVEQDSAGLLEYVRQWFSDSTAKSEEDFKSRLEEARAEAAASAREEAREEAEKGFQNRLEQACAEASAIARRESEAQIEDLREQLEASRKALTLAVASSQESSSQTVSLGTLKAGIDDIDSQRTQSDTLSALVRRAAQFAPRVVFFVIKSGDAVGWKAGGFENGLNDETAKLLTVSSQKQTLLRDALTSFSLVTSDPQSTSGAGEDSSAVLGLYSSPVPGRAIAIPLIVRNKAAAVLYADSGTQSESLINTTAIESLMRIAGMAIELLPSRRGAEPARPGVPQAQLNSSTTAPSPATTPEAAFQQPEVQPAIQEESAQVEPESKPEIQEEPPSHVWKEAEPQVQQPWQAQESAPATHDEITDEKHKTEDLPPLPDTLATAAESPHQAEALSPEPARVEIEAEPGVVKPAPRRITKEATETFGETFGAEPQFEPPMPPSPPPSPAYAQQTMVGENMTSAPTMPMSDFGAPSIEERAATPGISAFQPPPAPVFTQPAEAPRPAQPVTSVPTPGSETEQRAHNDARRFARLLVSEIKLYNAAKVNDGRRNYDLYDRLKDEIDRSRKVYDKRVAPAVAARFDYFYDELVQTLAEGDPAKLGKNCPGPVVLA
ncbi:MAG: hypothetical protein AB7U82_14960 [Blastocatellales bacterium]